MPFDVFCCSKVFFTAIALDFAIENALLSTVITGKPVRAPRSISALSALPEALLTVRLRDGCLAAPAFSEFRHVSTHFVSTVVLHAIVVTGVLVPT